MKASTALSALLSLMLLAVGAPANAQGGDETARAHFSAGSAYFDEGDYAQAVVEFRAAYQDSQRPALLYNIYLCEERLARLAPAIEALEQYLASNETIDNRSHLEARLGHLRERLANGATTLDDPDSPFTALMIAGFSIAAVGAIGFAVFGSWTIVEDENLAATCSPSCSQDQTGLLEAIGITADVSMAVGLVGAALGVIGLVLSLSQPASGESAALELRVGPGTVGLGGTF